MKHVMLKTTLGLFGLLLLSSGARAQTTTFDVTNPNPAEGKWHVVVVETGSAFTVDVVTGAPKAISDGDQVQVTFLDTSNHPIAAVNDGGGVVGFGAGAWNKVANGDTMDWKWVNALFPPVFALDDNGSNQFLGSANILALPGQTPEFVDVTVFDSINGPWTETEELTTTHFVPEASSLALLLPGLIPMGIALRRRCKTRA